MLNSLNQFCSAELEAAATALINARKRKLEVGTEEYEHEQEQEALRTQALEREHEVRYEEAQASKAASKALTDVAVTMKATMDKNQESTTTMIKEVVGGFKDTMKEMMAMIRDNK